VAVCEAPSEGAGGEDSVEPLEDSVPTVEPPPDSSPAANAPAGAAATMAIVATATKSPKKRRLRNFFI
jgi:hypothetical protein